MPVSTLLRGVDWHVHAATRRSARATVSPHLERVQARMQRCVNVNVMHINDVPARKRQWRRGCAM